MQSAAFAMVGGYCGVPPVGPITKPNVGFPPSFDACHWIQLLWFGFRSSIHEAADSSVSQTMPRPVSCALAISR